MAVGHVFCPPFPPNDPSELRAEFLGIPTCYWKRLMQCGKFARNSADRSHRAVDEEGAENDDAQEQRAGGTDDLKFGKIIREYHYWNPKQIRITIWGLSVPDQTFQCFQEYYFSLGSNCFLTTDLTFMKKVICEQSNLPRDVFMRDPNITHS